MICASAQPRVMTVTYSTLSFTAKANYSLYRDLHRGTERATFIAAILTRYFINNMHSSTNTIYKCLHLDRLSFSLENLATGQLIINQCNTKQL